MTKQEFRRIRDYLEDLNFKCAYMLTSTTIWTLIIEGGNVDIEVLNPNIDLSLANNDKPITVDIYSDKTKMNSLIKEVGFNNLEELRAFLEEDNE